MQPVPEKPQFKPPSLSARFNEPDFFTNRLPLTRRSGSWVPADLSSPWQSPGYLPPPSQSRRATPTPPPPEELLFLRLAGNNQTGGGKSRFTLAPLCRQKAKAGLKDERRCAKF